MGISPRALQEATAQLERIQGVDAARILTDAGGVVVGVDAIADRSRPAQRIVRDVEVVLRRHRVDLDHRKISIAQLEDPTRMHETTESTPPSDPPPNFGPTVVGHEPGVSDPALLSVTEERPRLRTVAIHSTTRHGSFAAEVEMVHGAIEGVPGRAEGPAADPSGCLHVVAQAALDAVRNLLEPGYEVQLREVRRMTIGGEPAVLVAVDFGDGREVRRYLGSCPNRGSLYDAAVYAVLDALNRPLGRVRFRTLAVVESPERDDRIQGASGA